MAAEWAACRVDHGRSTCAVLRVRCAPGGNPSTPWTGHAMLARTDTFTERTESNGKQCFEVLRGVYCHSWRARAHIKMETNTRKRFEKVASPLLKVQTSQTSQMSDRVVRVESARETMDNSLDPHTMLLFHIWMTCMPRASRAGGIRTAALSVNTWLDVELNALPLVYLARPEAQCKIRSCSPAFHDRKGEPRGRRCIVKAIGAWFHGMVCREGPVCRD
jgi:hypothetical protein